MSTRLGSVLLFSLAAVACGDNNTVAIDASQSGGDAPAIDAPAIDAPHLTAVTLTLLGDVPVLYQYRDGSNAWQAVPAPDAQGQSTIMVQADYEAVAVCAGSGSGSAFDGAEIAAVAADGDQFILCQTPGSGAPPATFLVSGTMKQPGSVRLGNDANTASGNTMPWAFGLAVPSGTYNVLALNKMASKMMLRRGIVVGTTPFTITQQLDVDTEGGPFTQGTVAVTGAAASAKRTTDTRLFTGHGSWDLGGGSGSAAPLTLAPAVALQANDLELGTISETTASTEQLVEITGRGSLTLPTTVALLPQLTGITFTPEAGTVSAKWTTLPTSDDVETFVSNATQQQSATATAAYIAAHAATRFQFDVTAPGYKAEWNIQTLKPYFADLTIHKSDAANHLFLLSAFTDPASAVRAATLAERRAQLIGASRKILP